MKYRYKLMICILIIVCSVFGIGGLIIMNEFFDYSIQEETYSCQQNFQSIRRTIQIVGEASSQNYFDTIQTVLKRIDSDNKNEYAYIKMTDIDNNSTIYCSDNEFEFRDIYDDEGIVYISWKAGEEYYYQISEVISIVSSDGTKTKLILSGVYDLSKVYRFREKEVGQYRKSMLVFILISIIASYIIAGCFTRPIEKLSRVVEKIASGDYKTRAVMNRRDEIGNLASDINSMADKIENDIEQITEASRKQERFMGSFAHEMKTPMTSIIGYADILRSQKLNEYEMREAANYIFMEGRRLESLSLKMLELIVLNNEEIKLAVHNPREVIYETVKMQKFIFKNKNIKLKVNCPNGKVRMDCDLFKSLIINLCDNAAKSMDNSGCITIVARSTIDKYIIQIKDEGCGMTQEEINNITEAFYRVDKSRSRAQGGAGLGLAICKKIIEVHNASIVYKSIVGEGTIVQLTFKQEQ